MIDIVFSFSFLFVVIHTAFFGNLRLFVMKEDHHYSSDCHHSLGSYIREISYFLVWLALCVFPYIFIGTDLFLQNRLGFSIN